MEKESTIQDDYRKLQEKFQQTLLMTMQRDAEIQHKNLEREIAAHRETQSRLERQIAIVAEVTAFSAAATNKLSSLITKYEFALEVLESMELSDVARAVIDKALDREEEHE